MSGARSSRASLQLGTARHPGVVAGIDEAGRGPLAGPVVAAAVVLCPERPVAGLDDSKRLSASAREALAEEIREKAAAYGLGRACVAEIDRLNILQATLLAMTRAVAALAVVPDVALVDGKNCPALGCRTHAIVKGDATYQEIAAASILAKVARDHEMMALDAQFPLYGFARHKGYPTKEHLLRLRALGVLPIHRRSFGPVRAMLTHLEGEPGHEGGKRADEYNQSRLFV